MTNTEAKVYLALVKSGSLKVYEIAKISSVARPDVYRTVSRLIERGLVKKIVSSPNEFSAIPIFDALSMLLQKKRTDQAELAQKADILVEKYRGQQNTASNEKLNQFILIPEKETLARERIKAAENAKEKILLMIPLKKLVPILTNFCESFNKAIERKVHFQIITDQPENGIELKKLFESLDKSICHEVCLDKSDCLEVRTVPPPIPANFGIYDGKEIRLSLSSKSAYDKAPDIWSNNSDVIALLQDYFKIKWEQASPTQTQKKPKNPFEVTSGGF